MSADFLKHALDALKIAPRYLVAIALVMAFLLFAPAELAQQVGIGDIAKDYRTGIGILFLACCALLLVGIGNSVLQALREVHGRWQFKRHIRQCLGRLTEDEKQILRFYIVKQTRANRLRFDDGVVQGLASKHIIMLASKLGNMIEGFEYNINDVAWDVLNEKPVLLVGTTNTYRTDKRNDTW